MAQNQLEKNDTYMTAIFYRKNAREHFKKTRMLQFPALHFIALHRYCVLFFLQKAFGNPVSIKSTGTIFPTVAHFMSLCQILVTLTIFQTFKLLLYLLW